MSEVQTRLQPEKIERISNRVIMVTGADGMLAREFRKKYNGDAKIIALPKSELDISDPLAVHLAVARYMPEMIINCAAITDVDGCETYLAEDAFKVNMLGPKNLIEAANMYSNVLGMSVRLIHISTDFVFDGRPHNTGINVVYDNGVKRDVKKVGTGYGIDPRWNVKNPINMYGKSKHCGEEYVINNSLHNNYFIIRTSWLFGMDDRSFLLKLLKWGIENDYKCKAVTDLIGSPTYTGKLVEFLIRCVDEWKDVSGVTHFSGEGAASKYDMAKHFLTKLELTDKFKLSKCKSTDFSTAAAERPKDTHFNFSVWNGTWKEHINAFVDDYHEEIMNYIDACESCV